MPSTERPAVVEGRTITTLKELQEFCEAAVAVTDADPAAIRLNVPQGMRITQTTLPTGAKVFDLQVTAF